MQYLHSESQSQVAKQRDHEANKLYHETQKF